MWRKSDESKQNSPGASPSPNPAPQQSPTAAQSSSSSAPANVNRGIKFKGEISGQGDLVFDGEFEGSITLADGTFTVGPNARVTAEIEAPEIVVRGEVIGSLKARERVHIWSTGKLTGNLDSRGIMIDDGAELHSKVAVPRAAPRVVAQKVSAPQVAAPKAPELQATSPAVPASEIAAPEVLPEAKPVASLEALAENAVQAPPAEIPPRAKRAAVSTSAPTPKES